MVFPFNHSCFRFDRNDLLLIVGSWDIVSRLESLPLSIALIIGYAGGDFIENIFKIVTKEPELFKLFEKEDR